MLVESVRLLSHFRDLQLDREEQSLIKSIYGKGAQLSGRGVARGARGGAGGAPRPSARLEV